MHHYYVTIWDGQQEHFEIVDATSPYVAGRMVAMKTRMAGNVDVEECWFLSGTTPEEIQAELELLG